MALTDNQTYYMGSLDDSDVFTLEDRATLDSLAERFAPNGVKAMQAERHHLLEELRKNPNARPSVARSWLAEHDVPTDDDYDALVRLRDKAHHAKVASMDQGLYQFTMDAVDKGIISSDQAVDKVRGEQAASRRAAFETANAMVMNYSSLLDILSGIPEAAMDDATRDAAIEEFEEYTRWERAKEEFRARYDACKTITEKAELRGKFPDLARAVFGR